MTYPNFELIAQEFLYARLNGNIGCSVYDDVPQQDEGQPRAIFPYVTIGESTSSSVETDSYVGKNVTVILHIWSRAEGQKEVKTLVGAIYSLLHRINVPDDTYYVRDCWQIFGTTMLDPDRRTRHGVMQFRITMTE
jgi:hypothetical protein